MTRHTEPIGNQGIGACNVKRVLLIEDCLTYVFALTKILTTAGTQVVTTGTLAAAKAELAVGKFDVVLLDLNLPDSSGLDTLYAVLRSCDLPTVIITSSDDRHIAAAAISAGADEYLVKGPLDAKLLGQTLCHTVERHQFRAKLQQMAKALRVKNERLEQLDLQKSHMLGMAAHDIRNPLQIILGYARLLQVDALPLLNAQHRAFLDAITESSEFILRLVDELLDIAPIESGQLHIKRASVDLVKLVANHVELMSVLAARKNIRIALEVPDEPLVVHADGIKLEQVLSNLIGNAIKFSDTGSLIKVRVSAYSGCAEFVVEDQGPGIPPNELDRLFTPFAKTSVRATSGERSTGLGLAIARRIVEGHGGYIAVESAIGKGTTFRVILSATM